MCGMLDLVACTISCNGQKRMVGELRTSSWYNQDIGLKRTKLKLLLEAVYFGLR